MALKSPEASERIRRALLKVSLEEYARCGVNNISLKSLAAKAGVTHGAFYWHFKNRDALIFALANHYRLDFESHYFNNLQALEQDALKALQHFLLDVAQEIRKQPEQSSIHRLFYQRRYELPAINELDELLQDEHKQRCGYIDKFLKQARKQKQIPKKLKDQPVAEILLGNLFGMLSQFSERSTSSKEAEAQLKLSFNALLKGLAEY